MIRLKMFTIVLVLSFLSLSCSMDVLTVSSPNGKIEVEFLLQDGKPFYKVDKNKKPIIRPSRLGIEFKDGKHLSANFSLDKTEKTSFDETWEQPWGEVRTIRNNYNELKITLQQNNDAGRLINLVFKVYDDGVGFRYEFPDQPNLSDFQISDELTEFVFPDDHDLWWIPVYSYHRYEYLFKKSPLSQIDTVHTPLTIETKDGQFLSIHEANLTDYASMTLFNAGNNTLSCDLVPWSDGVKVYAKAPHVSPWRTIQIADNPGDLITSYLILNLNEPNKLDDVSWIKPGKYVGIWWGMHLGSMSWGSGKIHGATTINAKKYIDFAARYDFSSVLIEGWNTGWDGDWVANGKQFSFTQPYPDFDIATVSKYAAEKGVKIIGHHETAADIGNYESQRDHAFALYQKFGIETVKTGYVGTMVTSANNDQKEWHHGQYMVRHYRSNVKKAAEYNIGIVAHEPIKDTGIRRTYPNMLSREGARGQEFNAWSEDGGNGPAHLVTIPFTRGLSGPFDFTPGIFDLTFETAKRPDNRVSTTIAKQLAAYVVVYSPVHMAADLIENYENQPAFQFIVDVPTDWENTKVLNGEIGQYITVVRKDRNSENWYLGSMTNEKPRTFNLKLDFLAEGVNYEAQIYADGPEADWDTNPLQIDIATTEVNKSSELEIKLAAGGGQAIRFIALK